MRFERLLASVLPVALSLAIGACSFDIDKWFERNDPRVESARRAIAEAGPDGGDELQAARIALEEVLRFRCEGDGGQDLVIERPGAALDLGLVIFRLSELIGRRFGEEELMDSGGGSAEGDELVMSARVKQLDCAHLLLIKMASDPKTEPGLALRARYLLGNIAFLARRYKDAVARYDEVLLRHPARGNDPNTEVGPPADDDAVARFAAWNRAIALERLLPPDAGDAGDSGDDTDPDADDSSDTGDGGDGGDAGDDGANDGGNDGASEGGADDAASDSGNNGQPDGGDDAGGEDTSTQSQPPPPQPSSSAPAMPSSSVAVDLRELDRFDQKAPLDLDFKARLREKRKIPKKFDK